MHPLANPFHIGWFLLWVYERMWLIWNVHNIRTKHLVFKDNYSFIIGSNGCANLFHVFFFHIVCIVEKFGNKTVSLHHMYVCICCWLTKTLFDGPVFEVSFKLNQVYEYIQYANAVVSHYFLLKHCIHYENEDASKLSSKSSWTDANQG